MMKTKYSTVEFESDSLGWKCKDHFDCIIGTVRWWEALKSHVFITRSSGDVLCADCHRDIADFLEQANAERKAGKT